MNAIAAARDLPKPAEETVPAELTRAEARRQKVLVAASDLFATKGFEATSMRDIAAAAGLMSGSLYYHFASKEELYVAVQDASVSKIFDAVRSAIADIADPWDRLEAAAVAHCEALLGRAGFRVLVTPMFPPGLDPSVRRRLVAQRDRFERMMEGVIAALPLPPDIDRRIFQKHYLGALNATGVWYSPDGDLRPAEIGRQIVGALRR
ncbi:MAG TPA: TetR/AcrR family transcriptional regulator [Alphaproteobacteria bacterium]|nr:TetR/AcrR family transcriptional regulator [Alphaproteobacteria bacterium]